MPSDAWSAQAGALLEAALAEFGVDLIFGAYEPVPCITDPDSADSILAEHGYTRSAQLVVEMRRSDYVALSLDLRLSVTVDGRDYRILRTSGDPADVSIRLILEAT